MSYVDGYLLPVPRKNLSQYRQMAKKAGRVWKEHGALDYKECVQDDEGFPGMTPFSRGAKAKKGEVVIFAYVVYKNRAHRNQVNKRVMSDPRISGMCDPKKMPFDVKRMMYGGFKVIVDP